MKWRVLPVCTVQPPEATGQGLPSPGATWRRSSWKPLIVVNPGCRIFVVALLMCLIFMKRCIFLKKLEWSPLLLSASHDGQAWPKQMLREYNSSKRCKCTCTVHRSVVFLKMSNRFKHSILEDVNYTGHSDMDLSIYGVYSVLSRVTALWCLFHKNINIRSPADEEGALSCGCPAQTTCSRFQRWRSPLGTCRYNSSA